MPTTLHFYHDAALTQEVTEGNPLVITQRADGSIPPVDTRLWLGSTAVDTKFVATSDPGVDNIEIYVGDSLPSEGNTAANMTLALSQSGLGIATPGEPLVVGVELLSGVSNAFPFWVRMEDSTGVVGEYTDVRPMIASVDEVPV